MTDDRVEGYLVGYMDGARAARNWRGVAIARQLLAEHRAPKPDPTVPLEQVIERHRKAMMDARRSA